IKPVCLSSTQFALLEFLFPKSSVFPHRSRRSDIALSPDTMAAVTTSSKRPYHVIVFGASGFTGKFVVEEVARTCSEGPGGTLQWAVAGRNRDRLEKTLVQAANSLCKPELKCVEVIVADVTETESLAIMCKQAVIVLNCVGPYRLYGEPVVKACIENGAHYIDICGEPQFLEGIQLNYHSAAQENAVFIIGSCGFDSIPADMGIIYTQNHFKGTLTAVESFLTVNTGPEGGCGHDTTWHSAIFGFADRANLKRLRKKFGQKPLPVIGARNQKRGAVFFSREIEQYALPFMGSDPSVVRRTQRYMHEEHEHSPVQYMAYVGVGGLSSLVKTLFVGLMFWFMFPEIFSFGLFSKTGPSRKQMNGTSFCLRFLGKGYTPDQDPSQGKPNFTVSTQITGPEPGYIATSITMVQAALTLLNEPLCLPSQGGVFTPGSVFSRTSLIERLNNHGIQFSLKD
ncbi:hypothetical protein DNTS_014875, partial [Danionella cerebrum]